MQTVKRKKSHFGCVSCKTRKIKCDETKPICRRCQIQNLNCVYIKDWSQRRRKTSGAGEFSTTTPESSLSSPANTTSTANTSPSDTSSVKQLVFTDAFTSSEPLADVPVSIEVKLIYQWLTVTWQSFGQYGEYFQTYLTEKAFKNRLLFDSILLLSAAHHYHINPTNEYNQAIEVYKFRTIAGVRKAIESTLPDMLPAEELAWSSGFLALFWLTCDTDSEFTGMNTGWRPLFRGMADIFRKIVKSDSVPAVLQDTLVELTYPTGGKYLPCLQAVYKNVNTNENMEMYDAIALKLAKLIQKVIDEPEDKPVRYISNFILSGMPEEFIQRINDFDPIALTFLAIFFAVLSSLPFWFLGIYSWKHHLRIKAKIPSEMHHFLRLDYLGLKPSVFP